MKKLGIGIISAFALSATALAAPKVLVQCGPDRNGRAIEIMQQRDGDLVATLTSTEFDPGTWSYDVAQSEDSSFPDASVFRAKGFELVAGSDISYLTIQSRGIHGEPMTCSSAE